MIFMFLTYSYFNTCKVLVHFGTLYVAPAPPWPLSAGSCSGVTCWSVIVPLQSRGIILFRAILGDIRYIFLNTKVVKFIEETLLNLKTWSQVGLQKAADTAQMFPFYHNCLVIILLFTNVRQDICTLLFVLFAKVTYSAQNAT